MEIETVQDLIEYLNKYNKDMAVLVVTPNDTWKIKDIQIVSDSILLILY